MYPIKKIKTEDTYFVRNEVLRPGKPIESCHFDQDNSSTTTHFGAFDTSRIIGVASVYKNQNTKLNSTKNQFQLRGMAVLNSYQGKGIGALLLKEAELFVRKSPNSILWFNARESAVAFYQKQGYHTLGDSFDIEHVGTHYVMYK